MEKEEWGVGPAGNFTILTACTCCDVRWDEVTLAICMPRISWWLAEVEQKRSACCTWVVGTNNLATRQCFGSGSFSPDPDRTFFPSPDPIGKKSGSGPLKKCHKIESTSKKNFPNTFNTLNAVHFFHLTGRQESNPDRWSWGRRISFMLVCRHVAIVMPMLA